MIHFWMILSMLINHPKLDDLYDPFLDGYTKNRKRLCNPQQLTTTEIRRLIRLLEGEQLDVFAKMIDRLGKGSERLAPEPYRAFLSELSRSTPVCGMLQVCPLLEFR